MSNLSPWLGLGKKGKGESNGDASLSNVLSLGALWEAKKETGGQTDREGERDREIETETETETDRQTQ